MVARRAAGRAARRRESDDARGLELGAGLTIVEARATQQALIASLGRGRAEADARGLGSVDTAGLQVLLSAGRAARERGLRLKVMGARALLLDAASSLGLAGVLTEVVELMP